MEPFEMFGGGGDFNTAGLEELLIAAIEQDGRLASDKAGWEGGNARVAIFGDFDFRNALILGDPVDVSAGNGRSHFKAMRRQPIPGVLKASGDVLQWSEIGHSSPRGIVA
jgi:hypothetical protein